MRYKRIELNYLGLTFKPIDLVKKPKSRLTIMLEDEEEELINKKFVPNQYVENPLEDVKLWK